jgi:hypothetical protein
MKTNSLLLTLTLTGILAGYAFAAGPGPNQDNGPTSQPAVAELSDAEAAAILFMREEEKVARDVYLEFAELYDCPIFANIAAAEQRHMDAVGLLILKYGLDDPIKDYTPGTFATPEFAELFDAYVSTGSLSLLDALKAGLEIEELDIEDLEQALATEIQAGDVEWVFENLLRGSYRHLRAFSRAVATGGESCALQGRYGRFDRTDGQTGAFVCRSCGRGAFGQGRGRAGGNGSANGTCDGSGQADRQQNRDGSCQADPEPSEN